MYVNPFWFGVVSTLMAEFVAFIVFAVIVGIKSKK